MVGPTFLFTRIISRLALTVTIVRGLISVVLSRRE